MADDTWNIILPIFYHVNTCYTIKRSNHTEYPLIKIHLQPKLGGACLETMCGDRCHLSPGQLHYTTECQAVQFYQTAKSL